MALYTSPAPQDSPTFYDVATFSGNGGVTWPKSGLAYVDCGNISVLNLQVVGAYTATLNFEVCNDNQTTWLNVPFQSESLVPLAENVAVSNVASMYDISVRGYRYFRVRVSGYTSSPTLYLVGRAGTAPMATQPVQAALETGSVISTKTDLTPSAPTTTSVGVASATAVAAAATRKGLVLTNTSANIIYLGFGANAAVVGSGITLYPNGGTWEMDEYTFDLGIITAIATGATSNLAIQEFLT